MGRHPKYSGSQRVYICSRKPNHRVQESSERRAIINLVVDNGGSMTLDAIDDHFGYDAQHKVAALVRGGWLAFEVEPCG